MGVTFGASSLVIGIIMSSSSLTNAVVASQLGKINRRFSLSTLVKLAFAVYALSLILIPLMPSLWLLLIPTIIFGMAGGVNMPSVQTLIAGIPPPEYRAAFMSINATMFRLGQTLGPPLMGLIYAYQGLEATFFVTAALALIVPAVGFTFARKRTS